MQFIRIIVLTLGLLVSLISSMGYAAEKFVDVGSVRLWTESFGDEKNPAIILISGLSTSGIFFTNEFCQSLVGRGYFVIRYDHRDVGLSTHVDYKKNPYDVMDLSRDTIAVLDAYSIKKATVMGGSMGGFIAQLLSIHYPERVNAAVALVSTSDFRSTYAAFMGQSLEGLPLSTPKEIYLQRITIASLNPPQSIKEKINRKVEDWRIGMGTKLKFPQEGFTALVRQAFERDANADNFTNHFFALQKCNYIPPESLAKIKVPVLIIQGGEDPILGVDHGHAMAQNIPNARLIIYEEMGHGLHPTQYNNAAEEITQFLKTNNKTVSR